MSTKEVVYIQYFLQFQLNDWNICPHCGGKFWVYFS